MKSIKVICPCYNEELSLDYFYGRFQAVRNQLSDRYDIELVIINNASTDKTLEICKRLRAADPTVQYITHARNFGYQASLLCALTNLRADAYVVIDADCEDPPEMLVQFTEQWEKGFDLVYGERHERPESAAIVAARQIFYRLTKQIADSDFIIDMAEFSLFTDRVRQVVVSHNSTFPFVRSDLAYAGLRRFGIKYAREPRRFGKTNYNLWRMTKFAWAGILSASTFLLRTVAYFGIALFGIDLLAVLLHLFGWGVDIKAILLLNLAFIAMSLTFLSIYIARISKDVIGRPVFIVDVANSELNLPLVSAIGHRSIVGGVQ